ncbi:hypothetical protein GH714_021323 [Hevea brasiliensis]|uniref:DUF4216 domain-containing protein n=1 Tax=Hevea brasiliensis TaxID=3981 RepID=A0A6A6LB78_HEVBR|nr:hypothetical protein GH714_021323 [Hevea brasiliensis]
MLGMIHDVAEPKIMEEIMNDVCEKDRIEDNNIDVEYKWDVNSIGRGIKIDKHGFVSVNTSHKLATNEPFVLASQGEQVFYVNDGYNTNCYIVLKGHPANFYDLSSEMAQNGDQFAIDEETFQQDTTEICDDSPYNNEDDDDDLTEWERNDMDAFSVDVDPADDVIEEEEYEFETDDEDLLL